jgi:uncharacterized repeat protein (TIGR02543 family)
VTLYAQWTKVYGVSYSAGSADAGSAPGSSATYRSGDTVTVKGNIGTPVLTRSGYGFGGWTYSTALVPAGATYAAGSTFVMGSEDVTLTAAWTSNPTYTVTYDGSFADSGTVPADAGSYKPGETVTVKGNTGGLVKAGNAFAGWFTDSSKTYVPGDAASGTFIMPAKNAVLFAKWVPRYSVKYVAAEKSGGSVPTDSTSYAYGAMPTVKSSFSSSAGNIYKISGGTGYRCYRWMNAANGASYSEGEQLPALTSDIVLVCVWQQYALRDIGPAGGYIFYDKGSYDNQPSGVGDAWRYLEAAPDSTDINCGGSSFGVTLYGTSSDIGAGLENCTYLIGEGRGGDSVAYCDSLTVNSYSDWFLPSLDELNAIYVNLKCMGVGTFQYKYYSSYTGGLYDNVYYQNFTDGVQFASHPTDSGFVRASRRF